jgi:hypothetical protein
VDHAVDHGDEVSADLHHQPTGRELVRAQAQFLVLGRDMPPTEGLQVRAVGCLGAAVVRVEGGHPTPSTYPLAVGAIVVLRGLDTAHDQCVVDFAVVFLGCNGDGTGHAITSGAPKAGPTSSSVIFDPGATPVPDRLHARQKLGPRTDHALDRPNRLLGWCAIEASAAPCVLCAPYQCLDLRFVRHLGRLVLFVPERRDLSVFDLAAVGIGADLLERLPAVGDLHQLGGAAGADADLFECLLPLGPGAGTALERREILTGGDVVLLGFLGRPVAPADVRPDRADQSRLIRAGGRDFLDGGFRMLAGRRPLFHLSHVRFPFAGAAQRTPAGIFLAGAGQSVG